MKVGRDPISRVTDGVIGDARARAQRPPEDVYAVIFLDALIPKIRGGGSGGKSNELRPILPDASTSYRRPRGGAPPCGWPLAAVCSVQLCD